MVSDLETNGCLHKHTVCDWLNWHSVVLCLLPSRIYVNLYNKRRYVCLFGCLFVCIYVPYSRPNGSADRDETWHTHSCPPRKCFWQGQCQGHSRMPARLTAIWNIWHYARRRHLANGAPEGSGLRQRCHLANGITMPLTRRDAEGVEQRTAQPRVVLRPEDGWLELVTE